MKKQKSIMGKYVLMLPLVCVFLCTLPAFAQLGSGWVSYSPTKKIHLNGDGEGTTVQTFNYTSYQSVDNPVSADFTYDANTDTEIFRIVDNRSNRSEIRLYNEYSTGSRQFEGYVTFDSPLNDESLMQIFGSIEGATQLMVRGYSENGGSIKGAGKTLITNCYGQEVRVNVIHLQEDVGNKILIYINGEKMAEMLDNESVTNYHKYGCYGTLRTGTATVRWRRARFFKDGMPPETDVALPPAAPSGLLVSAVSESRTDLKWADNSNNETAFQIERSADLTTWESLATVSTDVTSYSDTYFDSNIIYSYRVMAVNDNGHSPYSNVSSVIAQTNITQGKAVTVSNVYSSSYGGENAVDGSTSTRWATKGVTAATLEVDLGENYTFSQTLTKEYNSRITSYKVQYWDGSEWKDACTGATIGESGKTDDFLPVTGSKVRLNILSASSEPSIYEFAVYGRVATASGLTLFPRNDGMVLWCTGNNVKTISFRLNSPAKVDLSIYDLKGNHLITLLNAYQQAGTKSMTWDTSIVPNGVYLVRMKTENSVKVSKLMVYHP